MKRRKQERLKEIQTKQQDIKKHTEVFHNKKKEYDQKIKSLKPIKEKYQKKLLDLDGVYAVGLRVYEEKIAVYCNQINQEIIQNIPLSIDGYQLDIIYHENANITADIFKGRDAMSADRYQRSFARPLRAGDSFGNANISAATLGSLWYSKKLNKRVGISNNHVVADENRVKCRRIVASDITCTVLAGGNSSFVPLLANKGLSFYKTDVDDTIPSTINSISPTSFKIGDIVTITGNSLGFRWGYSKVFFNGIEAPVKSWTATGDEDMVYLPDHDRYRNVQTTIEAYVPVGLIEGGTASVTIEVEGDPMVSPSSYDNGSLPIDTVGQAETFLPLHLVKNGNPTEWSDADVGVFSLYDEIEITPKVYLHPYIDLKWERPTMYWKTMGWEAKSGAFDTSKGDSGVRSTFRNFFRNIEANSALEVSTKFTGTGYQEAIIRNIYKIPPDSNGLYNRFNWAKNTTISFEMYVPFKQWENKKIYTRVSSSVHTSILMEFPIIKDQVELVIVNKIQYAKIQSVIQMNHSYALGNDEFKIHFGGNYAVTSTIYIDNITVTDIADPSNIYSYDFLAYFPFDLNESYQIRGFVDQSELIEGMAVMKTGRTTGTIIGVIKDANTTSWCNYETGTAALYNLVSVDAFYKYGGGNSVVNIYTEMAMSKGGDSGSSMVTCPPDLYERFYYYYSDLYKQTSRPSEYRQIFFHPDPFLMYGNNFASDSVTGLAFSDTASTWLPLLDLELIPLTFEFYPMAADSYSIGNCQLEFIPMIKPKIVSVTNGNITLIQEKTVNVGSIQLESFSVPIDNNQINFELTLPEVELIASAYSTSNTNAKVSVSLLLIATSLTTSNAQAKITIVIPVKMSASSISTGNIKVSLNVLIGMTSQSSSNGIATIIIPFSTIQLYQSAKSISTGNLTVTISTINWGKVTAISSSTGKIVLFPYGIVRGQVNSSSTVKLNILIMPVGWTPNIQYEHIYFEITRSQDINTEITKSIDLNLAV